MRKQPDEIIQCIFKTPDQSESVPRHSGVKTNAEYHIIHASPIPTSACHLCGRADQGCLEEVVWHLVAIRDSGGRGSSAPNTGRHWVAPAKSKPRLTPPCFPGQITTRRSTPTTREQSRAVYVRRPWSAGPPWRQSSPQADRWAATIFRRSVENEPKIMPFSSLFFALSGIIFSFYEGKTSWTCENKLGNGRITSLSDIRITLDLGSVAPMLVTFLKHSIYLTGVWI